MKCIPDPAKGQLACLPADLLHLAICNENISAGVKTSSAGKAVLPRILDYHFDGYFFTP